VATWVAAVNWRASSSARIIFFIEVLLFLFNCRAPRPGGAYLPSKSRKFVIATLVVTTFVEGVLRATGLGARSALCNIKLAPTVVNNVSVYG
jgi:hypothetical protein